MKAGIASDTQRSSLPKTEAMGHRPLFAVVLAAGAARRFGGGKQLAALNGEPMVKRTLKTAEAVVAGNLVLVVGDAWQAVHSACSPLKGYLVRNDDPDGGMAGSLAVGTRAIETAADGLLLMLADQPLIDKAHLENLVNAWNRSTVQITCSRHGAVDGPPVIFPRRYFAELRGLNGDRGAKILLKRHAGNVLALPCPAAALDVDTVADLQRAERALKAELRE